MKTGDYDAVPPRRQAGLLGGGGASALLALPAAVSVGVVLAGQAAAQSVIASNQDATVMLGNYTSGGPVRITAGTTISPATGPGVVGAAGHFWSLSNAGTIDTSTGDGVVLAGGTLGERRWRMDHRGGRWRADRQCGGEHHQCRGDFRLV
jgi:hypothetical protein